MQKRSGHLVPLLMSPRLPLPSEQTAPTGCCELLWHTPHCEHSQPHPTSSQVLSDATVQVPASATTAHADAASESHLRLHEGRAEQCCRGKAHRCCCGNRKVLYCFLWGLYCNGHLLDSTQALLAASQTAGHQKRCIQENIIVLKVIESNCHVTTMHMCE